MPFSSLEISNVFSLLIVSIFIYVTQYYYCYFTRPNPLPGPFPLPIIGNAHQKFGIGFKDWYKLLHKKYGDMFEIYFVGRRSIILCNIDLIENMLIPTSKTKYPYKLLITEGLMEYLDCGINGMGLINNNDQRSWKYNRQFFAQAMLAPCLNNQAIEWTNELWEEMESYWNNLGENKELDLISWMRRFTSEIIYKIATGVKSDFIFSYYSTFIPENSLNEKEKEKIKESEKFIESFDTFSNGTAYFLLFNKFIRDHFPFIRGKVNKLLKIRDYCFEKMYNTIRKRRIEIENTPLDQPLRHDMLTSFLTANTPRDINSVKHADDVDLLKPMTDKEIFGNILDAMRAGSNSALNMICFVIYYLEHYPEVKQRFRQELETVLGKDLTRLITVKDIGELQYCDAVIKEVSRLSPVVFMNCRVSSEEDVIGGFSWPKETSFNILNSEILKRKDYWTDPEKFDPDRFYKLEEDGKYLLEKKYINKSFAMFGHGIRICPGRKLVMMEMKFLLASIYRKYDVELVDMNAPLKCNSDLFLTCKELIARVKPRKF